MEDRIREYADNEFLWRVFDEKLLGKRFSSLEKKQNESTRWHPSFCGQ
jgi:hypothetical protein